MQVRIS